MAWFWIVLTAVAYTGMTLLQARVGPWSEHLGPFLLFYAAAWLGAWGVSRSRMGFGILLLGAALFRGMLIPLDPTLSDDIYRYVWEGRVQQAGFDPYRLSPLAPELASLRDDLWSRINHPDRSAIYPPLAQLVFRVLASLGSISLFKTVFCVVDLVLITLLGRVLAHRGHPTGRLALYAWNPLIVVEIAGSGHLEPLGALPLVAGLVFLQRRPKTAWLALAGSIAIKYVALLPLLFAVQVARPRWRQLAGACVLLVACFAVYAGAGWHLFDSLRVYAEHWRFNDLGFSILLALSPSPRAARFAAAFALAGVCFFLWRRNGSLEGKSLAVLLAALLLAPTIHPWYLAWPLALLPLRSNPALWVWSGTVALSYLFVYPVFGMGPIEKESWLLKGIEMTPVVATGFVAWWVSRGPGCRASLL